MNINVFHKMPLFYDSMYKDALIASAFKMVFFCFVVTFKASLFAVRMGFPYEDLTTQRSLSMYSRWLNQSCQPNYWKVLCSHGEGVVLGSHCCNITSSFQLTLKFCMCGKITVPCNTQNKPGFVKCLDSRRVYD